MHQLQALELMTANSGVKNIAESGRRENSSQSMGFNLDLVKLAASQDGRIHTNRLLPELIADIQELSKLNLALELMSELVQEYSDWTGAQQGFMRRLPDVPEGGESSSNAEAGSASEEDAEKRIEEGLEVLKRTFSLDVSAFVAGVCWQTFKTGIFIFVPRNPIMSAREMKYSGSGLLSG